MRLNEEQPEKPSPAAIRGVLLETVEKLATDSTEAEQLLLQCAGYYHNHRLIHRYAGELGLELTRGTANASLQVYYDIQRHGGDWGYISRGWEEPGFRLGQVLKVPNDRLPELRRCSEGIIRALAARGIAITIEPDQATNTHDLQLTTNISDAGFNPEALLHSLQIMFDSVQQIRRTVPCE